MVAITIRARFSGVSQGDTWPAEDLKSVVLRGKAPMGRTFLAIVGLIAFLSGHTALRPLPHIRLIPRSRSNARRIPINFRTRCQTGNLEERLSGCRADFPVGSSFNFQDHRRATPRAVHLSSSQVRYSSQANTGNGLGLPEPGHRPNSLGRWPAGGKIGPAPQLETPKSGRIPRKFHTAV